MKKWFVLLILEEGDMSRIPRLLGGLLALLCASLWATAPADADTPTLTHGFCYAEASGSRLYLSAVFTADASSQGWESAFNEYLEAKYGGNRGPQCFRFATAAAAQAYRQQAAPPDPQYSSNYVETGWSPTAAKRESAAAAAPAPNPPKAKPPTIQPQANSGTATTIYGVCLAIHTTTRYFSAAFSGPIVEGPANYDLVQLTTSTWRHSFGEYVLKKYSGILPQCTAFKSMAEAEAYLKQNSQGPQDILTGWAYTN